MIGSDGSLPTDRIARYCNIDESWAESTVFGVATPLEAIYQILVCDGHVGQRGFRNTLFCGNLRFCGVAGSFHPAQQSVVSIVYVKGVLSALKVKKLVLMHHRACSHDLDRIQVNKAAPRALATKPASTNL